MLLTVHLPCRRVLRHLLLLLLPLLLLPLLLLILLPLLLLPAAGLLLVKLLHSVSKHSKEQCRNPCRPYKN